MKLKIYQINLDRDEDRIKFMSLDTLPRFQKTDKVNASIYDEVFSGEVEASGLEDVYRMFNTTGHPLHRGHSLSVSDMVVTEDGAYFCDSVGFQKVDFDESLTRKPDNLMRACMSSRIKHRMWPRWPTHWKRNSEPLAVILNPLAMVTVLVS